MPHPSIIGDYDHEPDDDYTPPLQLRTPQPTLARPGSELKITVLQRRFEREEALWHDDDYREPRTNTITIIPTGMDRAAMGRKLIGNGKPKKRLRSARIGFYREPK
jgi:hypothetical protein